MAASHEDYVAVLAVAARSEAVSSLIVPRAQTYAARVRNALAQRIWDEGDSDDLLPQIGAPFLDTIRTALFLRCARCLAQESVRVELASPRALRKIANFLTAGVLRDRFSPTAEILPDDTWPFDSTDLIDECFREVGDVVIADLEARGIESGAAYLKALRKERRGE